MVELLLKRYLWLIDTLKRGGEMTFEQISDKWDRSSVNDNGTELTKRTFYNHCQAVARHFGIDIECRRGRGLNVYRIVNPEAIEENSLTKWALDSFSLGELLLGNATISDKILLEDIPSGREWLEPILQALQCNHEIEIEYENFVSVKFSGIVKPLCVKLFKRRWYLLSLLENGRMRIFSLDRIKDLTITDNSFDYPREFSPSDYFHNFFGIITTDDKVENIIIRAYAELPGYLRSLPMHHSQRELESNPSYTDFSLRLVPTFDFVQELLLHRDQIEVLAPECLRIELSVLISKMQDIYVWLFNQNDKLREYKIEGNIAELRNIRDSNALVMISSDEIISVLSKSKPNYIRIGWGNTLFEAYENGYLKEQRCKLVYIYFAEGGMSLFDLNKFIESLGDDIIFGYSRDETMNSGVKLIMIFN